MYFIQMTISTMLLDKHVSSNIIVCVRYYLTCYRSTENALQNSGNLAADNSLCFIHFTSATFSQ